MEFRRTSGLKEDVEVEVKSGVVLEEVVYKSS